MTTMRPSSGLTPNCTLEPPVSTPISRSTASEALRMIWYSLSVSVSAGATVMESPVCTPMGSMFSIEQMMMQLSSLSRTTSISYSFPPRAFALRPAMLEGDERIRPLLWIGERLADALGLRLVLLAVGALEHGGVGEPRARRLEPDLGHRLAEQLAVLGLVDDLGAGADHLHPVFVEHAGAIQAERGVERGLPTHGG